jgi:hypothetical protein
MENKVRRRVLGILMENRNRASLQNPDKCASLGTSWACTFPRAGPIPVIGRPGAHIRRREGHPLPSSPARGAV